MTIPCSNNNGSNRNNSVCSAADERAEARRCRLAALVNLLLALFATTVGVLIGAAFAAAIAPFIPVIIVLALILLILLIAAIILGACGSQ